MRDKLRRDKHELKKWKLMDEKMRDMHRQLTDEDFQRGHKLRVAIVQKEMSIYKQIDIIRCQQKLLIDLITRAVNDKQFMQTIGDEMKPTITFDPEAIGEAYKRYLERKSSHNTPAEEIQPDKHLPVRNPANDIVIQNTNQTPAEENKKKENETQHVNAQSQLVDEPECPDLAMVSPNFKVKIQRLSRASQTQRDDKCIQTGRSAFRKTFSVNNSIRIFTPLRRNQSRPKPIVTKPALTS